MLYTSDINIRNFKKEDYDKIASWHNLQFVAHPTSDWLNYILNNSKTYLLVAEKNHEICGYCQCDLEDSMGFLSIVVKDLYRRKGIGKELHIAMVKHLKNLGAKLIKVYIQFENTVSTKAFKSYGYKQIANEEGMVQLEISI